MVVFEVRGTGGEEATVRCLIGTHVSFPFQSGVIV